MAQDLRPASSVSANTLDASNGFIEHHVSKLDTLAGVAIKYGVEVFCLCWLYAMWKYLIVAVAGCVVIIQMPLL